MPDGTEAGVMAAASSSAAAAAAAAEEAKILEEAPPHLRAFLQQFGARDLGASHNSAMCISHGLMSATASHIAVDEGRASADAREMYLAFLGSDSLEALVEELTLNIQRALGGAPLSRGCGPLSIKIDDGTWVHGLRAGACLTVGRHPRCGLQLCYRLSEGIKLGSRHCVW